ncbi:MAG: hypothetical protein A2017_11605 [Lentisphaerae bacterium GWF2_44_16]|nr:MAG: hypothetical protein A2017_11605 [Lentisphaerae bacterium GWF2_44_16]
MGKNELIEKYFESSLAAHDVKDFRIALKKDPELLKEFLSEAHLENAIENYFASKDAENTIEFPKDCYDGELTQDDLKNISAAGIFLPPEDRQ